MTDNPLRMDSVSDHLSGGNGGTGNARHLNNVGLPSSRRRALTRAQYAAYIKSDAWRTSPARLAELLASGGRCRICDAGPETSVIHIHHRRYDRLGCELVDDLTALCQECHDVVTDDLRRRNNRSRKLPSPRDLADGASERTLVDSLRLLR